MTERWPTYNVLKICVVFVESTAKSHYCWELSKTIGAPLTTTFNALEAMRERGWLQTEREDIHKIKGQPKLLYNLTPEGLKSSVELLTSLRVPVTGYHPGV